VGEPRKSVSLLYCVSFVFCLCICFILLLRGPVFLTRTIYILVMVGFDFFQEEGFMGETFLFFKGLASSLGGVTSLGLCSASTLSSPPQLGDIEGVFSEVMLKFWTS
jgi:hypothetical protein